MYVPDKFLGLYVPDFLAKRLTKALRRKWSAKIIVKLLEKFGGPEYSKYAAFLKIGSKKTQHMVFNDLRKSQYPEGTRFVVLPLNFRYMGAGKLKIGYRQQLDDLIGVKKRFPNTCLPFVFIDPRMGTSEQNYAFVKEYIDKGFVGIKLYPSLGYYPFDYRLEKVYKFAEENEIPIMTHCSTTGIYYKDSDNIPHEFTHPESFNKQSNSYFDPSKPRSYFYPYNTAIRKKKRNDVFTDNFLQPENYIDVLKKFPSLKLCFAHFGLDNEHTSGPFFTTTLQKSTTDADGSLDALVLCLGTLITSKILAPELSAHTMFAPTGITLVTYGLNSSTPLPACFAIML